MFATSDLETWLVGLSGWPTTTIGTVIEVVPATRLSKLGVSGLPDRCVFLARTGGPGEQLERAFDAVSFQFRFRGAQGDADVAYDDADALSGTVDDLLLNLIGQQAIGAHKMGLITRVGGPPAYLLTESRRVHFTGNYVFTTSR